ncbi:ribonuclease BN [Lachnospiraceae bacterium KM106-2]|nr:ribonuclease BN [Lachnospiraceae bacterium KM106-2]
MLIQTSIRLIKTSLAKFRDDFVGVFSAQAAFFIILSFFPFLMCLLTLLQYLPIGESFLMQTITDIMPSALHSFIIMIISEIYDNAGGTIISVTVITAMWSASKGFLAIVRGLNKIYDINETRNYFKLRFISAIYTFIFAILIMITLGFLVFGNRLYIWVVNAVPLLEDLALLIISLRTIGSLFILIGFFLLLYIFIPNRKTKFFAELPGAILSATGWLLFSYLYSFYIDNMSNMSATYGSLTAIVLLMLWLYFCMYILFIGAECNVLIRTFSEEKLIKKK